MVVTPRFALPIVLFASIALVACSSRGGGRGDTGVGDFDSTVTTDSSPTGDSRVPPPDTGIYDPFDPSSACGSTAIPTERVPGSLLLAFDRSGSMSDTPSGDTSSSGDPSKWDLATASINSALSSVGDDLSVGLLLFPTGEGSECDVALSASVPHVPIAPLSTSRPMISSALASASPTGGNTPYFDALRASYDYLDTLDTPGQRGVILVTDGAENCDRGGSDALMMQVTTERMDNNYLTYAVGLTESNNDLSTIAFNGGTKRNDTCLPECTSDICSTDADCPGAGTCNSIGFGIGICNCSSDADCVAPQTCTVLPILGGQCSGDSNCCHYDASESSFEADFTMALEDIARRFLESCVFELPRGTDPSTFDPTQVNVGVTFEGEERNVLGQSEDDSVDSWNYTTPDNESIIIQGPICDRLLMESGGVVEIVLGCPTILI
jgi:hypothetical protein